MTEKLKIILYIVTLLVYFLLFFLSWKFKKPKLIEIAACIFVAVTIILMFI